MLGRIFPKASYQTAAPFVLAALLLVATLLISFLSGYQIYRRFDEAKTEETQKNLEFLKYVAETYESSISGSASLYMNEIYGNLPTTDKAWKDKIDEIKKLFEGIEDPLAVTLDRVSKLTRATSVVLFYPQQYVIFDSSDKLSPGSLPEFRENDKEAFLLASSGTTVTITVPTTLHEPQVVHQYTPIRMKEKNSQTGAVLRIEVPYNGLKQTDDIRKLGLSLAAVVTGLTAIVALLFYRLMSAFIRISETAAHADRLQAMGTLSAGIAHELRNPLGIIRALAEGLRSDFEEDDPRREMVDDITGEVERLGRLVADYLQFARPDVRQPDDQARPIEIIENLMLLIRKGDKASVPLELRAAQNPPNVDMNSTAFRQVMMNLIMNAIEASDSNQPIMIEFQTRRNNSQVRITVTDRGCGISERELRHIFDPFYTLKAQGTGLGLAICYQLVTECRGKINIESAEGKGTTVELILPAVPAKPRVEANN
ncbi:MAG TPA: HAMP domain-containing sensor histidine kinase [Candidatus Sumerlaeota bacterium]|nr:HAMP domain-containing sensor histidine kinase [Candidatus Sumerlaeota bacterium]